MMGGFSAAFVVSVVAVILFECIPGLFANIKCYRCLVAAPVVNFNNETIRLCKDFDYSERFIVNCPYSTYCMKKLVSAKIPYPVNGTERDCASQKKKRHNYQDKKWHIDYVIEDDPYEEGCGQVEDKGFRTTRTEYCYCKGDLCNSTFNTGPNARLYILSAVIVAFFKLFVFHGGL